ncbi:D-alanine--D-alanine ligase [Oceanobacillus alkalisoli]|uniref:D-alanine--D-alanine ligase n=1 Tax=Oceanobacillus alkalisoli TaxID=2925113 RepID=UPI001EE43DE2|nr:D-alanine--D-alanine ligase [Oceanobacillus alkalisoli]MCG5104797.1 D-alanine--D-alanine ligase [Oceanobacillus alkalisoli]
MKKRVGLIFGGKSAEHEVSLQSAKNVLEAMDKDKYDVTLIGIDKEGRWHLHDSSQFLLNANDPKLIALNKTNEGIAFIPGETDKKLKKANDSAALDQLDVIFPILHGTLGEDGSIQGMLRVANIPFVGSNVLGSAISMDKDVAKRLLKDAGLKVAGSYTFTRATKGNISFAEIERNLGLPLFIKPANQGSSVGVSKVESAEEFEEAIAEAFKYDHKILIEEAIQGREIECSILGNEYPEASIPGEIVATNDFYSYEAKYIDESGATLEIPAKLDDSQMKVIQEVAVKAFQALNCEGMARVDVFLTEANEIIINEINTIPGFTKISMYPKLWELSGVPYSELIDRVIELAIERHERDAGLESSFETE